MFLSSAISYCCVSNTTTTQCGSRHHSTTGIHCCSNGLMCQPRQGSFPTAGINTSLNATHIIGWHNSNVGHDPSWYPKAKSRMSKFEPTLSMFEIGMLQVNDGQHKRREQSTKRNETRGQHGLGHIAPKMARYTAS